MYKVNSLVFSFCQNLVHCEREERSWVGLRADFANLRYHQDPIPLNLIRIPSHAIVEPSLEKYFLFFQTSNASGSEKCESCRWDFGSSIEFSQKFDLHLPILRQNRKLECFNIECATKCKSKKEYVAIFSFSWFNEEWTGTDFPPWEPSLSRNAIPTPGVIPRQFIWNAEVKVSFWKTKDLTSIGLCE